MDPLFLKREGWLVFLNYDQATPPESLPYIYFITDYENLSS